MTKYLPTLVFALTSLSLSAQPCVVSSYPFNGNANDAQVAGNNGTVNGAILTTDRNSVANSAYEFDGVDDYILVNEDFDVQEKTLCIWFNAFSTSAQPDGIVGIDHGNLVYGNMGAATIDVGGTHTLRIFAGGQAANVFDQPIALNTWYHLAIVRTATSYLYYLNCNLISTEGPGTNASGDVTAQVTTIGVDRLIQRFFHGKIDDIFISNCALTSQQICNKYNEVFERISETISYEIYPNPVEGNSLVSIISSEPEVAAIAVYNSLGEQVYTGQMNNTTICTIDANLYSSGLYYAVIESKKAGMITRRFIVK